jgi:polyketide cyclase/dehydrase/lipid transport protein
MATIHLTETTTATPEQVVSALTDFGPERSKIFGRSAAEYLKVHDQGPGHADVTEGSAGVWERLTYDWTDPSRITMTTTDSNTWGGASGHTYTLTRQPDGTTKVDVEVVREGKNLKGKLIGTLLRVMGPRLLGQGLAQTIKAIEARNAGPAA